MSFPRRTPELGAACARRPPSPTSRWRAGAAARRVPSRLWRRRQRPDRLGPRMGEAAAPCRLRLAPCAGALRNGAVGRQWFNLTFREAGELDRGVKQAAPVLNAFLDTELKRHQSVSPSARTCRLQPGNHDGARRGASAQSFACGDRRLFRRACRCRGAAAAAGIRRPRSCWCMATWTRSSQSMPC